MWIWPLPFARLRGWKMLTKRIIPCLDVMKGRVVKGVSFVNLRDAGDPVELAAYYNQEGADEIAFLDITASYEGRATMLDVVRRTAEQVFIPITVGGGIRSVEDINAKVSAAVLVPLIASGGVGTLEHLYKGFSIGGADAVLAASIFHFGDYRIRDVKQYLQSKRVAIRPC